MTLRGPCLDHLADGLPGCVDRPFGDAAADGMHRIFAPVSFQVRNGDRIVLQGRNGSGKSSVIKYLLGEDITATGLVTTQSGLKISYVAQDADNLCGTLRDYIREHQLEERLMKQFLRKMDFEREQFEKRLEEYSAGQKKKVLLAKSLCEQAHLYIWDEPLNYIDIFSRMQLEELILKYAPTLILVEHDKSFVERVATKVVKMVYSGISLLFCICANKGNADQNQHSKDHSGKKPVFKVAACCIGDHADYGRP